MWRRRLWRRLRVRVRIQIDLFGWVCFRISIMKLLYPLSYVLIPNAIGVSESQLYNKQNNPYVQANAISTTKAQRLNLRHDRLHDLALILRQRFVFLLHLRTKTHVSLFPRSVRYAVLRTVDF